MGAIIKRNNIDFLDLVERGKRTINSASLSQGMLTDDTVKFSVSANSKLDIKINDTVEVFGNTYRINTLPTFKKISNSDYAYEIEAQGLMYDLLRCKFFNTDGEGFKTKTNFPLIGNLEVFLIAIRNNMHRFSIDWEIGTFASSETKMINFGDDTCLSALQKICQEFKTDFWVKKEAGKFKIHTGEFGSTLPISFEYGKRKGLYGLERSNIDDNGIVNRLYVNGGSNNIPAGYRNFSDNLKFSDVGYLEDTALIAEMGLKEGSIDFPEIYPKRTGVVSAVGSTKFKFIDSSMDFDLNEKNPEGSTKYLIGGTNAKVSFTKGNLAGYEFEIKKNGYTTATKQFEIIPFKNESGQQFPDEVNQAFQIEVGDEYVLLDIVMPPTYIANAEAELLVKGNEQFALNKTAKVSYSLNVDPEYLKTLATPISIGDYVRVIDTALGIDKVIRVQAITRDFITANEPTPYNYKITLADSYEINYASQMILDITEIKNVISITNLGQINLSQLGYKTTQELRNLIFDTDGFFDPENIKPLSITTNMLTVGAQSQQLSCSVVFLVNNAGNPNQVEVKAGALYSQTFNKSWIISGSIVTIPDNNARYVYAKCSKIGTSGSVLFSQSQIKFDEDPNDFYFLLGVLHTVTEGVRVLSITIGTTTINGGLIRTGIISSLDGQTYFNLNTGEFKGKFIFSNGTNVQTAVENAQNTANVVQQEIQALEIAVNQEIDDIKDELNDLDLYIDGAFSDGLISQSEAVAIEKYINQLNSEKGDLQNKYNVIYNDDFLSGSPKTNLSTAWNNYVISHTTLLNSINTAIADGLTTPTEKADVDAKFLLYRNSLSTLSTRFQESIKAIENASINAIQVGGRNLVKISKKFIDSNSYFVTDFSLSESMEIGQTYIVTVWTKAVNQNGNAFFRLGDNSGAITNITKVTPMKFQAVFIAPRTSDFIILFREPNDDSYYQFDKIKLEKGNKATDWTPAPEDIDVEIAQANTNSANALAQAINAQNAANAAASVTSFLKTTIDGNVVNTGTLQVGSADGANAGISGVVDQPNKNSVRFWAGSPYSGKETAPWVKRENGIEEEWLNGVMIRRKGVMNGNYFDELYNINGQLAKRTAIVNGKVLEQWFNNGVLVYEIGQNGIYYVAEIPESFTYYKLLNLQNNDPISDVSFFESKLIQNMWQSTNQPERFELRGGVISYVYKAGQNVYSESNKQYEGFKNTESKYDNLPNGWYAYEILGFMEFDENTPSKRNAEVFRVNNGKVIKNGNVNIETNGHTFNQF